MKIYLKRFFKIFIAVIAIIFVVIELLSLSAAKIFNYAMAEQKMLKGTITVEEISADITGTVKFENFLWKDIRGNTILEIPEGNFKVSIIDIVTKKFSASTIKELNLSNANISLVLDEKMQVDFINHSHDFNKAAKDIKNDKDDWEKKISYVNKSEEELKRIGEHRRKLQREKIEQGWKNFDIEGRKIKSDLKLENCRIEILYRDRHYLFSGVNFETEINTDDKMTFKVWTGVFGGTMIGRGMRLNGEIDFKTEIPQCYLSILLQEVDPSSLGFGLNIHDEMTLSAYFTGDISRPAAIGNLKMKELHIPGLDFKNIEGNIYYIDSTLNFYDVTAEVYDGELTAHGDYNLDTRYYNIYGEGKKLKAYTALPRSHLHCDVDLNITINSKGNARKTFTSGDFSSSNGRYSIFKIKSISGKFKTEYNSLNFYDVQIDTGSYKIMTDALSIQNKKLVLSPINLMDARGNIILTY